LLDGLTAQGHTVANVVANDTFTSETVISEGYPIYKLPSLGLLAGTAMVPSMPWIARQLCKRDGFEIAHLHFPDPLSHLVAYTLPRRVKIVVSWHSDIVRQQGLLKLYRPFLDNIVGRADAIIAATNKHFTSSTQMGAAKEPGRLHVVPYGISYTPFDAPEAIASGKKFARSIQVAN